MVLYKNANKNAKKKHTCFNCTVEKPLRSLNETFDDHTKPRIPRNASKRRNMETFRSHLGYVVDSK